VTYATATRTRYSDMSSD